MIGSRHRAGKCLSFRVLHRPILSFKQPTDPIRSKLHSSNSLSLIHLERSERSSLCGEDALRYYTPEYSNLHEALTSDLFRKSLVRRKKLYKCALTNGMTPQSFAEVIKNLPVNCKTLYDLRFVVDLLVSENSVQEGLNFIVRTTSTQPTYAEKLLYWIYQKHIAGTPDVNLVTNLLSSLGVLVFTKDESLGSSNPSSYSAYRAIIADLVQGRSTEQIISSLARVTECNPQVGARLCTAFMQIVTSSRSLKQYQALTESILNLKQQKNLTNSVDLHLMLKHFNRVKNPNVALKIYDENPGLHEAHQLSEVLIASGMAGNWDRLQSEFEQLDISISSKAQSEYFAAVFRTIGNLGSEDLIEQLYADLRKSGAIFTPDIVHGIMRSYKTIGSPEKVKQIYDLMINNGEFCPNETSFEIMISCYKDASDLAAAMLVLGEQLVIHSFPLTNRELTSLISLCAKRRDIESARALMKWGKIIMPGPIDRFTWNAYLDCLAKCNLMQEAFELYKTFSFEVGIDTLSILMNVAARFALQDPFEFLLKERERLELKPDAVWFGSVLFYWVQKKDYEKALEVFDEMKKWHLKPNVYHYGTILELQAKQHRFASGVELVKNMNTEGVQPSFDFYTNYLHLYSNAGATAPMREKAKDVAFKLISSNYFDSCSHKVPRNKVPAKAIKRVFRRELKKQHFITCEKLLAGLRAHGTTESYKLSALFLELYYKMRIWGTLDLLWSQFIEDLRRTFVLYRSATGATHYKLPHRYRNDYWRQVNIRLADLNNRSKFSDLLKFPKHLEEYGIAMTTKNWNYMVQCLAKAAVADTAQDLTQEDFWKTTCFTTGSPEKMRYLFRAFDIAAALARNGKFNDLPESLRDKDDLTGFSVGGCLSASTKYILNIRFPYMVSALCEENAWAIEETLEFLRSRYHGRFVDKFDVSIKKMSIMHREN